MLDPQALRLATPNQLRETLVIAVLALVSMALFLVSPRVPRGQEVAQCVTVMELAGPVHLTINCDSFEFVSLAHTPALLLAPSHRVWQSRPLYPVAGWVAALPFRLVPTALVAPLLARAGDARFGPYLPEFVGLLLINLELLVASVVLFQRLMGTPALFSPWTLLPLAILVVNEVTKAFFWTPHLQMFNLFAPVASLALFGWLRPRLATLRLRYFAVMGLLLGLGGLLYGAFAVTVIGVGVCVLVCEGRLAVKALRLLLLLAAFAAPIALWIGFVVLRTGSFYSHEVAKYRQFVWMADALAQGLPTFLVDLGRNLAVYSGMLITVALFPCLLLAAALLARLTVSGPPGVSRRDKTGRFAVRVYLLAALPFYGLLGYYATRLAWSLVPAILLLLGLELQRLDAAVKGRPRLVLEAGLVALSALYVVYWVVRAGPYS